jgi:hypothetical protein
MPISNTLPTEKWLETTADQGRDSGYYSSRGRLTQPLPGKCHTCVRLINQTRSNRIGSQALFLVAKKAGAPATEVADAPVRNGK